MSDPKDWKRLGEHVVRRRADLGLTQIELAQRGPLSLDRVQSIEGAKRSRYRIATLVALERGLEWASGSVEAILSGGEPNAVVTGHAHATLPALQAHAAATATRRSEAQPIGVRTTPPPDETDLPDDPAARAAALRAEADRLEAIAAELDAGGGDIERAQRLLARAHEILARLDRDQ